MVRVNVGFPVQRRVETDHCCHQRLRVAKLLKRREFLVPQCSVCRPGLSNSVWKESRADNVRNAVSAADKPLNLKEDSAQPVPRKNGSDSHSQYW
jgi:hypothetical protein